MFRAFASYQTLSDYSVLNEEIGHLIKTLTRVTNIYKQRRNADLGILFDGTPVYVDPDCLNFESEDTANMLIEKKLGHAWKQENLETMYDVSRNFGIKDSLSWVLKSPNGCFSTKQEILYPDLRPIKPTNILKNTKKMANNPIIG